MNSLRSIWTICLLNYNLSKKDFQAKYLGSYLGILWAFIHPTITILIFWFVFQVGFKSKPIEDVPFILWLMAGIVTWFFIADGISNATNSIIENSFLVKKVVFQVFILPLIKLVSALKIHFFFLIVTIVMFWMYGYNFSIYYFQIVYYLWATIILVMGFTWLTSSLVVFLKDINQLVAMIIQFGFWITPIFWSIQTIPAKYQFIIKLNPIFYIVNGYRETFITHEWFWVNYYQSIYFWVIALGMLSVGILVFKRLRPHFADVL
jgi:ABC-type polysaccharide/polyol phosphate export permease